MTLKTLLGYYLCFQELLSLFGLPYLVAPTEAEAQCAALNLQELTQATITDDNDVFLFGGRKVYRHFFSQFREVEVYTSDELQRRLGQSKSIAGIDIYMHMNLMVCLVHAISCSIRDI